VLVWYLYIIILVADFVAAHGCFIKYSNTITMVSKCKMQNLFKVVIFTFKFRQWPTKYCVRAHNLRVFLQYF